MPETPVTDGHPDDEPTDDEPTDDEPTDDELTALALAADPDQPIPDDAVPFSSADDRAAALLPEWYMPAPSLRRSTPRTVVLAGVAIALFVINVGGVCVTYGIPDPVWR